MHLMRTVPTGPKSTRQEYDVYKLHTSSATAEAHQRMVKFYQKVTQEDIDLCSEVQKSMQGRVFSSGPLHPFHEEGVVAFQEKVMDVLLAHLDREEAAGKQIWPAERSQGMEDKQKGRILACRTVKELQW